MYREKDDECTQDMNDARQKYDGMSDDVEYVNASKGVRGPRKSYDK